MTQIKLETDPAPGRNLVSLTIGGVGSRPSLLRSEPGASFVSQLIAERQHLPPQRQRRRASFDIAVDAYRTGAAMAVVRMPQGYRKTRIV
jgi:hypothetical protein